MFPHSLKQVFDSAFYFFFYCFSNVKVRSSLILAITYRRPTSQHSAKLISGSLYQATQVTSEISLNAQVKNSGSQIVCLMKVCCKRHNFFINYTVRAEQSRMFWK